MPTYNDPAIPKLIRKPICDAIAKLQDDKKMQNSARVNSKDKLPLCYHQPVIRVFSKQWMKDEAIDDPEVNKWLNDGRYKESQLEKAEWRATHWLAEQMHERFGG